MPFTPSHAVVALPFVRTPLLPAAIAVGAMTPDLPLFVRGTPLSYDLTHTLAWLPLTAVVALVLLLVWRCLLRPAMRELAPGWLARRLPREWDADARAGARETFARRGSRTPSRAGVVLLVVSLLLGVLSHILWDLFTHEGRWGVEVFPGLDEQWGPLLGLKWLQHGSSVVGLAILGVWALGRLRRADADAGLVRVLPGGARVVWWASLPLALLLAWAIGYVESGPFTTEATVAHLAYRVLPPACAIWGVGTLALCALVPVLRRRVRATA